MRALVPVLLVASAHLAHGQEPAPDEAERRARVVWLQERARELMGELEDRMFRLSEGLRDAQPDDAARLVLALRRAREELIVEDMRAIERALEDGQLERAEELQGAVVQRLESLRGLLLSTDLDLLLKLERLRRLDALLALTEDLEAESARLEERLGELAEGDEAAPDGEGEPTPGDEREREGSRLALEEARERTELARGDAAEAAGAESEAAREMARAEEAMEEAGEALEKGDTSAANDAQSEASGALGRARADVRRRREELLWELQPHLRRQVIDSLVRMRDELRRMAQELGVEDPTELELPAEHARGLGERLRIVAGVGRDTRRLVLETDFSVHLPSFLEWTGLRLGVPERGAAAARFGLGERAALERVHLALDEMVQVLTEEEQRWRTARGDEPRRKMIKVVGELKGCRTLQRVLREDTADLDAARDAAGLGTALAEELDALRALEAAMPAMMFELDERYWNELAARGLRDE